MKTLNTQEKINNLKNDFKLKEQTELNKLELEILGLNLTGLNCSAIGEKWLSFDDLKSNSDIKTILKAFKPSKQNADLTFAGKNPIETNSPFLLCLSNYTHVKNDKYLKATLKYKTINGLDVWIKLDKTNIDFDCQQKQVNEHSKAKYPEMYSFFTIHNEAGLSRQYYAGGSITYYGTKEQFYSLLKI